MINGPKPKSIGALMAGFKSSVTKCINGIRNAPGTPVWQRNYHDRIIRDENELNAIRQYIADNPARWIEDRHHPANIRQATGSMAIGIQAADVDAIDVGANGMQARDVDATDVGADGMQARDVVQPM
jgi:hypothetical protein